MFDIAKIDCMSESQIRAVFFDFGGTLFSYRDFVGQQLSPAYWTSVLRLGTEISPRDASRLYWKASNQCFIDYAKRPYYLHRDLFRDTLTHFCELIEVAPDSEFIDTALERQRRFMIDNFTLRPDCLSTLQTLRSAGLTLSIVSNIDDDYLDEMITRSGLDEVLHHWSSSEEAQSCKPDQRFFEYANQKSGVQSDEVLFVGDSPHHDIDGAHAMGMTTVLIQDEHIPASPAKHEPHHLINELSELVAIAGVEGGHGRKE